VTDTRVSIGNDDGIRDILTINVRLFVRIKYARKSTAPVNRYVVRSYFVRSFVFSSRRFRDIIQRWARKETSLATATRITASQRNQLQLIGGD